MGVRLPAEYQEVEYLRGMNCDIDLNYVPIVSPTLKITFKLQAPSDADIAGFSTTPAIEPSFIIDPAPLQNRFYNRWGSTGGVTYAANYVPVNGAIQSWEFGKVVKFGEEIVYTNTYDGSWGNNNQSMHLFCARNMHPDVVIYVCLLYDGEQCVRNLVPCYRKADSEPGMYDLVSKTFYTNQGTGKFLVGPDVVNHISPRLMDRRRALIAKLTSLFRKVITSQTGLASFDTNVTKPMKVTCEFSPKQDLHGYDNPWPAGGGKNLVNIDNTDQMFDIYISSGTVLTASCDKITIQSTAPQIRYYRQDGTQIDYWSLVSESGNRLCRSFTATEDIYKVAFTGDLSSHYQLELGSTATAYAPYENICPIEAWDGANIYGTGNNIWNEITEKGYWSVSTGAKVDNNNYIRCANYIPVQPNTEYRFVAPERAYQRTFLFFSSSKNIISYDSYNNNPARLITPNDCYYITFYVNSGYGSTYSNDISINYPATDTTYHAYHGTTLPIPFNNPGTYDFLPIQEGTGDPSPENIRPITPGLTITRDDNTTLEVWGGSLTVNVDGTGSLASKYIKREIQNFSNVSAPSGSGMWAHRFNLRNWTTTYDKAAGLNNMYSDVAINNGLGTSNYSIVGMGGTADMYFYDDTVSTVEEFKTKYNGHYIVYETFTTTYTLSVAETSRAFEALGLGKNLGPLYGGNVTINEDGSCDAIATMLKVDMGLLSWTRRQNPSSRLSDTFVFTAPIAQESDPLFPKERFKCIASIFKWVESYNYMNTDCTIGYVYNKQICVRYDAYIDAAEFKSAMSGVELVYELQTPQTYHFSSIGELQSFLGTNNIWSDLNGPITVEYYKKQQ